MGRLPTTGLELPLPEGNQHGQRGHGTPLKIAHGPFAQVSSDQSLQPVDRPTVRLVHPQPRQWPHLGRG